MIIYNLHPSVKAWRLRSLSNGNNLYPVPLRSLHSTTTLTAHLYRNRNHFQHTPNTIVYSRLLTTVGRYWLSIGEHQA